MRNTMNNAQKCRKMDKDQLGILKANRIVAHF